MNVKCLLTVAVHGRVEIVLNISILGGYTVCRVSLVWFMNGNRNGTPLNGIPFNRSLLNGVPFNGILLIYVSVKPNFTASVNLRQR